MTGLDGATGDDNPQEALSRTIPLPIQRQVRQRCGFGCVICGLPLYEYDHMRGWANTRRHVASEITLLCDRHHREKTSGLLPFKAVEDANLNPFNLRRGVSAPYDLHYAGDFCEVHLGDSYFSTIYRGIGTTMVPLSVDAIPIVGFELDEGHLLLNLHLFDENNDCVLRVARNQLVYRVDPWDVQLVGRRLTVRQGPGRILLDVMFEAPNAVIVRTAVVLCNGVRARVQENGLFLFHPDDPEPSFFSELQSASDVHFGLAFGPLPSWASVMFLLDNPPRFPCRNREENSALAIT